MPKPSTQPTKVIAVSYAAVPDSSVDDMESYSRNMEIFNNLIKEKSSANVAQFFKSNIISDKIQHHVHPCTFEGVFIFQTTTMGKL